jgi:hypothetical protein
MSKTLEDPCTNCFYPFPRYAAICPACGDRRWIRFYKFRVPDRNELGDQYVISEGLCVIMSANHPGRVALESIGENGSGNQKLAWGKPRGTPAGLNFETLDVASQMPKSAVTLFEPVGYCWAQEIGTAEFPESEFPPEGRDSVVIRKNDSRDQKAYDDYRDGKKLARIANENGYPSGDAAQKAMDRYATRNQLPTQRRNQSQNRRKSPRGV